jgi:hypothetical protein
MKGLSIIVVLKRREREREMGKNYVVNFCVDEDRNVYVEKVGLGEFGYVRSMMFGEMSSEVELEGEEKKEVLEVVGRCIDSIEVDDLEKKEKVKKEMLEVLEKEIDKKLYEYGKISVKVFDWGVEYDNNVGVLVLEGF